MSGRGRPRAPEPYTAHNVYLYERHMDALRRAAHERKISVSAIVREMIEARFPKSKAPAVADK